MYKLLYLSFLFILPVTAMQKDMMQIEDSSIMASRSLGKVSLYHSDDGFLVENDNRLHKIDKAWLNPELRKLKPEQIKKFQRVGYFQVKQLGNGEFTLAAHARGKGGGPILANVFYWATKATCYGGALAATGAVVGATGGGAVALAAAGEVLAVSGSGVAAVAIASSSTAMTVATGATQVGLVAASTGGVASVVAGVEAAALCMGAIGMAIPFL